MSDLILKGKGVYYMDKEGVMHPMSFPPKHSPHSKISHFYINSITGEPFAEIAPHLRQFPKEKAAMILANEIMKGGYTDENGARRKPTTEANALKMAKEIFNASATRFNKIKRDNGDDFHTVPIPFDENGRLHPDYMNNHYGAHQSRRVPTAQRQTRTEEGKLINNHANNKAHPTLGVHLESAAFHTHKEFLDEIQRRGIDSQLGAKQNVIEPQQITGGVTRRYSSNEKDPTSKENNTFPSHYKDLHTQTAAYGQISPMSIVGILAERAPDLFNPSTKGGMSSAVMRDLMDSGVDQPTARAMARAPINQLLYGRGKDGSATGLRNVMVNMRSAIGIADNPEILQMYHEHRSHFSPLVRGGDRGRNQAAIELMAMLKTAEELGVEPKAYSNTSAPPQSIAENYVNIASQQARQIDFDALGSADEMHEMRGKVNNNYDHLHDSFPPHLSGGSVGAVQQDAEPLLPPQEAITTLPEDNQTQEPLEGDPYAGFGGAATGFSGFKPDEFQMSDDDPMGVIATIMERVQLHDAGGSLIVKYDPLDAYDMQRLSNEVGVSSATARAIAMSLGDWGVIAKSFNTTHDVVRVIKRSCGGALNG
jgi:hypothetical protein